MLYWNERGYDIWAMEYSIVVPMKNEEGNVVALIEEVEEVMQPFGDWEMICIDDGSTDSTLQKLQELAQVKPFLRILVFSKNFGQSSGFDAGFRHARGKWVITMDGDRQNDPRDIPKLIEKKEEYDLICGMRQKRRDPWHKKVSSRLANFIRSRALGDGMKDTGCSLKLYRKSALDQIKLFHGMHRFLPALFQIEGFRVTQIEVHHRPRATGSTKYNFWNRSLNTLSDLLAVRWMRKRALRYQVAKEWP